jgi:hypothetical protein
MSKKFLFTRLFQALILITFFLTTNYSTNQTFAQSAGATTSGITGVITDPDAAVISKATITAKNVDTNFSRDTTSSQNGFFNLSQLPPGNYEITVNADGFKTQISKVTLVLGVTARLDFILVLGEEQEIIDVTDLSGTILEEGKTESSTNIDRSRIASLPLNRRNFLDLSLTTARVTSDRLPLQGATATSGLSVNGQPARFNNVTIDGLDNNDNSSGAVRSIFSQDAVQEFQVVSDGYSAEFGRALGGVINIVTKSGSNEIHGGIFNFIRNDKTSAKDTFSTIEPDYKQYQFGGTLSGPIKKDKAFFFTSFERLSIAQNFIVTLTDNTVNSIKQQGFIINNGPIASSLGNTSVLGRADFRLNSQNTLYLRYNFGGTYNGALEPFGGLTAETNAGTQRLTDNTFALSNTYISPTANFINETRFLFNRRDQDLDALESGPQVRLVAPEGRATFGRSTFLPQIRLFRTYQIVDNITLVKGKNTVKFGVDFIYLETPKNRTSLPIFAGGFANFTPLDFRAVTGNPALVFSGIEAFDPSRRNPLQIVFLNSLALAAPGRFPGFPAGVPLASLSLPSSYIQGFGDPRVGVNNRTLSLFAQDDIKVNPNLLVKVGLRYDRVDTDSVPDNNGNFSPRIAFSYNSKPLGVRFRGSYGLFFGVPSLGLPGAVILTGTKKFQLFTLPFPFSVLPYRLPGRRFPESLNLPAGFPVIPQLGRVFTFTPNLRNSYSQQINFTIDKQWNNNTAISLSYDFVRGLKIVAQRNLNPVVRPIVGDPVGSLITGRVDPTQGEILQFESAFDSDYHAATISLTQKFSKKFFLLAHYTFSKTIDNFSDFRSELQETVDPLKPGNERGLSIQDVRSRFVLSSVYDTGKTTNPFFRDLQLSTIITLNSGRPYNLLAGQDLNLNGDNPPGDRPLVGNTSIARNAGLTPGFANIDFRLARGIDIQERYKIQGFVEFFNLFNRVNISDFDRIYPQDAQGNFNLPAKDGARFIVPRDRFRNAFSPRQVQFGFRISF